MKLVELLKSSYHFEERVMEYPDERQFNFVTDAGDRIRFDAAYYPKYGIWELEFSRNNKYKITGSGDALKIFSTVIKIVETFIKSENPTAVSFSSSEKSRTSFYDNLIKRLINQFELVDISEDLTKGDKKINGFNDEISRSRNNGKNFFLVKNKRLVK